ncbi:MAG: ATP-dependent DNA helicase RecG [Elusimicrobiota bacterium]
MSPVILADSVGQSKSRPLQYLKGVGPVRAQVLAERGIVEKEDLITTFPRAWEDRRFLHTIRHAPMGEKIALRAQVQRADFSTTRKNLGVAIATLDDATGTLQAVWFKKLNPRYDVFSSLQKALQPGRWVAVFGLLEWGLAGRQIRVEEMSVCTGLKGTLEGEEAFHFDRIVPLYTAPEGISERLLRTLIGRVLSNLAYPVIDLVPEWLRRKNAGIKKTWALQKIHFPASLVEKEKARQALAFEEFFVLETALGLLRTAIKKDPKPHRYELQRKILTPFRENLGFDFTQAQKRVIRDVFDDMMSPFPMNRLLQGDVGSGKTLVALSAMLLAVENGGQAVLMAPTEILAEQHALTLSRFLQGLPVRSCLITGRQTPAQRRACLQDIAAGRMDLVIGTHALIEKPVQFSRLMLAVIDEQHRFGVEHRSLLRQKGTSPDVLVMTATPIPRTLALTLYGDLDVSILDELPPGRTPIDTLHVSEPEAYARIREAVSRNRQAYIVFPLVTESDKLELKAAVQEATSLRQSVFRDLRVGLLHGQMPSKDKDAMMQRFRRQELDILIATSIIEVGIDIPNATVMAIQHAERFGLSTLHQLRGRVGRGTSRSQCLLIADPRTDEARRRIEIMTVTTDGFRLSEEDLALRGPGEVMGVQQHGLPVFKVGHLIDDARLIQEARVAAQEMLKQDPSLRRADHQPIRQAVQRDYASRWRLGSTG